MARKAKPKLRFPRDGSVWENIKGNDVRRIAQINRSSSGWKATFLGGFPRESLGEFSLLAAAKQAIRARYEQQ